MFATISAIFALLLFASTLPNGIRLVELPAEGDSVEIVAGYTTSNLTGLTSAAAAKSFLFDAYAAGGHLQFVNDLDRTALRITAPRWAAPMLADRLPALFRAIPPPDENSAQPAADFRAKIEDEIRSALLGPAPIAKSYATDDAFVLMSAPVPDSLRVALNEVPARRSGTKPDGGVNRLPAERTLRFKSDLPDGAVIFASPLPGVFYKQWYLVLLLDRLIHRVVRLPIKSTLPLTVRPYYYRMEFAVPSGQFPETAEETLLQEIQRLQFTAADARDLSAARQEALVYLSSKAVTEWFAGHDLNDRRLEGIQWVQSMTSNDMRIAARDLLIMNRVIASWAPRPQQLTVSVESLPSANTAPTPPSPRGSGTRSGGAQGEGPITRFPSHTDSTLPVTLPERLSSGVSIVVSNVHAIFVSGGALTRFDHEPNLEDQKQFQKYRADRILVLTPSSSMDRARQLWTSFKGTASGEPGVPKGKVSSGDLSALFVLKTLIDLRLLEAGSWPNVEIRLDASEGSGLQVRADSDETRAQIADWIKSIAGSTTSENYFVWAREVAIHHFDAIRADLQALTWERDPQGTIQPPETVSLGHVQDVARIYF